MSSPAIQHTANVVAVAVPLASFWARLPEAMSVVLMALGIMYYIVFFVKEIITWKKSWRVVKVTTTTHIVTEDVAKTPVAP